MDKWLSVVIVICLFLFLTGNLTIRMCSKPSRNGEAFTDSHLAMGPFGFLKGAVAHSASARQDALPASAHHPTSKCVSFKDTVDVKEI